MYFDLEIFKKNYENLYFDVFPILCDRIYFSLKNWIKTFYAIVNVILYLQRTLWLDINPRLF